MPLEIPKSPVQHPHHRASGFSIPGRLPCLLAVVLGLFAHSEALAQSLDSLTIMETGDNDDLLTPEFATGRVSRSYTATVENAVESLTVNAGSSDGTIREYLVDGTVNVSEEIVTPVPAGRTIITVRVELNTDRTQIRDYVITVTRTADTTAIFGLVFENDGRLLKDEIVEYAPGTRKYEALVTAATEQVTVTATPDSPTAEITWDSGRDVDFSHMRNLRTGLNTITATVKDGTSTRNYTIEVTRTHPPGAPRSLRVTASASNAGGEVTLSWSAPLDDGDAPIDSYQVAIYDEFDEFNAEDPTAEELGETNGGWLDVGEDRSYRVTADRVGTPLYNGRLYYFRVRAHNEENGSGNGSNDTSATPAGRPLEPENFVATLGNARVELTWDPPIDPVPTDLVVGEQPIRRNPISSYEYSRNGSWRSIPNSDESTTSHTVTGLNNGTTYYFQVRGRNRAGNGEPSLEERVEPESRKPGAPTGLTAQAGDEEVTLSWRAPANNGGEPITEYEYKYRPRTSPAEDEDWIATGGTQTTVTVYGLDNGETYYFKVRAVNDLGCTDDVDEMEGCGQQSLEVSAEPFDKPVTIVDLTDAISHEDSRVKLTWQPRVGQMPEPPEDDLSGFQYRQKAGGGYGSWIDIRNSDKFFRTHVVGDLTNGTTYTFQVRAVNSSGGGDASGERSAVPSTTPGAPTTLTATAGDDEVRLTWTPADDGGRRIISYECEERIGADSDGYRPCAAGKLLGASARSLTLTDDDDIENGKTYTFQVRAVNANGVGDWSDEATARPTDRSGTQRTFTISATIDGKSWARADLSNATILATVAVNPRYTAPSTSLWVNVDASGFAPVRPEVVFGPTNSRRDVSFTGTTPDDDITIALLGSDPGDPLQPDTNLSNALAVTRVEIRPANTPDPPTGLVATRGDGEVTLSWATPRDPDPDAPPPRRLRVPAEAATGFLWALDGLRGRRVPAPECGHDRDQQYGHRPHQRRDVRLPSAGPERALRAGGGGE